MSINLKDFSGAGMKVAFFLFVFSLFTIVLSAQPKDNAPYSRFGLGEELRHSFSSAGFGGLTAAYIDPLHVNLQNPASLGSLFSTSFEMGFFAERSTLTAGEQETEIWSGNLSHVALAFPMRNPLSDAQAKKKRKIFWGMNIGLIPSSVVGYDIEIEDAAVEGDTILNTFQGTGGTNKLVWGNGVKYKNFSAGLNIAYLFGQLETERELFFTDRFSAFNNSYQDDISVKGFVFTLGATYQLDLNPEVLSNGATFSKKRIIFGVHGNPAANFRTESTQLRIGSKIRPGANLVDTLLNLTGVEGDGKLPAEITVGVTYEEVNKLRVGVEYHRAAWSNYENDAKPEQLFDSNRFAVGIEYSPNATSYNNYLQRIRYRAGFYYRNDQRLEDLNQYALTFGLGLPVVLPQRKTSFVHLAFELGKFDTSNGIDENFVKMSLGFTLNDSGWFYKRKFR